MIETDILDILSTYNCYFEKPIKVPKEYVLVERITQTAEGRGLLFETRFAFRCVSDSLLKATTLSEGVKSALFGSDEGNITAIKQVGSANMTDPETREYTIQVVFDFTHY